MSETYDLYQQGRSHLQKGRAAQATVALEKAKRREPEKASIREALGIAYLRLQRGSSARISPVSNGWVRAANHSARAAARRRPRSSIGSFKTSSND